MNISMIDAQIKQHKDSIAALEKAKLEVAIDESTLYGQVYVIIEKHLHADHPGNQATREALFTPLMKALKPLLIEDPYIDKTPRPLADDDTFLSHDLESK